MSDEANQSGRWSAAIALAAIFYFVVASIAAHLLSTQYNPVRDYIADYALGPFGWIYASAFIAAFIADIALAAAIWFSVPADALSRAGAILLVLVGIMAVIDFFFPTDILAPGELPVTVAGGIHFTAELLGWVLFVIAAFLVSSRLRHDAYFRSWHGLLLGLAWACLVVLVILFVVMVTGLPIGGFVEKAFILVRTIWALCLTVAVLRMPSVDAAHAPREKTV
jgi:hypothetical protein